MRVLLLASLLWAVAPRHHHDTGSEVAAWVRNVAEQSYNATTVFRSKKKEEAPQTQGVLRPKEESFSPEKKQEVVRSPKKNDDDSRKSKLLGMKEVYSAFNGLYECPVQGEAYSAAYLTSKSQFLRHQIAESRLFQGQGNMEGASHALFRRARLMKTVDMFDFFIDHLSWYERRLKKKFNPPFLADKVLTRLKAQTSHQTKGAPRVDALAVMPFYATPGGDAGHSALYTRRVYLKMTIESLTPFFQKIAVAVASDFDYDFVKKSEPDLFDVLHHNGSKTFRPSRLGFATVFLAQTALTHDDRYRPIKYIFYTESDQLLRTRSMDQLFNVVNTAPNVFLIPHRVQPVPKKEDIFLPGDRELPLTKDHAREFQLNDLKLVRRVHKSLNDTSCCFDRNPCSTDRDHWRKFHDQELEIFQIPATYARYSKPSHNDSFALVAGEGNFLRQQFRRCVLGIRRRCPLPSEHEYLNAH